MSNKKQTVGKKMPVKKTCKKVAERLQAVLIRCSRDGCRHGLGFWRFLEICLNRGFVVTGGRDGFVLEPI